GHALAEDRQTGGKAAGPPLGRTYELRPVREAHFATHVAEWGVTKTCKPVLYGLIGIGIFLLLLACINYINMSVAQIPQRGKEIGVRKTLGGGRWQLISQFLAETLVVSLMASVLAYALARLGFWLLTDIIPAGVSPQGTGYQLIGFILALTALTTLLAGLHRRLPITQVVTVNAVKDWFDGAPASRGV